MSNDGERRSMDDVMASIRRIIRSEKSAEPEAPPARPYSAPEPAPVSETEDDVLPLTAEMMEEVTPDVPESLAESIQMSVEPEPELGTEPQVEPEPEVQSRPINPELSGGMSELRRSLRVEEPVEDIEPEPEAGPAIEQTPEPEASAAQGDVMPEAMDGPSSDGVMLDEAALESMVRRILREELMGEIGQNISSNVTRMIETEVARRLTGPK